MDTVTGQRWVRPLWEMPPRRLRARRSRSRRSPRSALRLLVHSAHRHARVLAPVSAGRHWHPWRRQRPCGTLLPPLNGGKFPRAASAFRARTSPSSPPRSRRRRAQGAVRWSFTTLGWACRKTCASGFAVRFTSIGPHGQHPWAPQSPSCRWLTRRRPTRKA